MLKYIRHELCDEYGILRLQDKILEIMVYIDSFCREYGIDYCLMAGSALGARRHQGFIPWDDDIDIYMTENDYANFREKFLRHGNQQLYYLQEWGAIDDKKKHMITMAKIRMNGTEIRERTFLHWNMHHGIFVDIFILHNAPDNPIIRKKQYLWTEAVVLKGLSIRGYSPKGIKDGLLLRLSKCLPSKWLIKHGLKNAYRYQDDKTGFYHGFVDTRSYPRAVFPADIMLPTRYMKFENVELRVPAKIDEYLRIQFGMDYMDMPPENKRQVSKHAISWDTEHATFGTDYSDECKLI